MSNTTLKSPTLQAKRKPFTDFFKQLDFGNLEQEATDALQDMVHARTIAAVSFDRNGKPTIPWAQAMGAQEFITTADDLPRMLACRDVSLTDVQASHIIGACAQILSESATRRLA